MLDKNRLTFVIVVSLLVVVGVGVDSQPQQGKRDIPTSVIGEKVHGITYQVDQGRSFHLIQIGDLEKKYLFLALSTDPIYKHLNVTLTIYKAGTQTPLARCLKEQLDSCYLPKESIAANQTLFVAVQSGEQCEYTLSTYWSDLEHINIDQQIRFMFSPQQKRQIYHLELEGKEYEELRIIVRPQTRRFPFDVVKMYGSFGMESQPSAQKYDFKSVALWQDGEGIYLTKKQVKNSKINLILYGETETVYTLTCTLVNKTHSDLKLDSSIYEYLNNNQTADYHISFFNKDSKLNYDQYVLRIALFMGDLSLNLFSDKAMTKSLSGKQPFMYMGDVQYLFTRKQIQDEFKQGVFIKTNAKNRIATYMMEFQGRSKAVSLELHEHIYEFLPIQKRQVAHFQVSRFSEIGKKDVETVEVTFSLIQVMGKVGVQFRKCTASELQCLGQNFVKHSSKIQATQRKVGTKQTFSLSLTSDFWTNTNIVEKKATVLVVLTNTNEFNQSFAAVEYNVGDRTQFLRENKPIQAHIRKQQIKVYKFVNSDPNIKKIRLHFNSINGRVSVLTFRKQPSKQELQNNIGGWNNSLNEITDHLIDQPIVIVVRGVDSATYSIVVQPIHQSQNYLNSITLSEDVQFKMKIGPNKYEVFEIVPIAASIFFEYKSTGAVHVCELNGNQICTDKVGNFSNVGKITKETFIDRNLLIKVRNPSSTKTIQIKLIFHSRNQQHCELKQIGTLFKEVVSEGKCFTTILDSARAFQVLIAGQDNSNLKYTMSLCDKLINFINQGQNNQRFAVSDQQVKTSCEGHSQITFSFLVGAVSNKTNQTSKINTQLTYLVQYSNGKIVIPDGVAYRGKQVTTESPLKIFTYSLLNKINTTVVLTSDKSVSFLGKIIEGSFRDSTTISSNDYHFSSPNNKVFFIDSLHYTVTASYLQKTKCKDCQLLIYVFSKEQIGELVQFTLQVTQNFIVLEDGKPHKEYLSQNSMAYYGVVTKSKGTLLVQVSDNNVNCAQLYLSQKQYPGQKNYLQKSLDGQLIHEVGQIDEKTFFISVKARKGCLYSIVANLAKGNQSVMKLQRGTLGNINMKEGQVKFFTFKHLSEKALKILSLQKYGYVNFYINKTTPEQVASIFSKTKVDPKSFTFHSPHKNRLVLDQSNKQFCKGCFYILAVEALKHTQSSIFLGDDETKIPISEDKSINDILTKVDSYSKAEFFYIEADTLQVTVHSGKLKVNIQYEKQTFEKIFDNQQTSEVFNFTLVPSNTTYVPANLIAKALTDNTVYSLRLRPVSSKNSQVNVNGTIYKQINPAEPNYISLVENKQLCLKGFIKRNDQKLFISHAASQKLLQNNIRIKAKIDGKDTRISMDRTHNVISIIFFQLLSQTLLKAKPYQLCLTNTGSTVTATVMQTQQTSLLPQNYESMVVNKQTYNIYPGGQFLFDLFECKGTSKISYGATLFQLKNNKPKILDLVGMPNQPHAVRIDGGTNNLLISIQGELALVRWLPINVEEERGIGYYLFGTGSLKYNSEFGKIDVLIEPLKKMKQKSKVKVQKVTYNLYASNSQADLQEASLCERFMSTSILKFNTVRESLTSGSISISIDKNQFSAKYKQAKNIFINVVANLIVVTPDGANEQYRFVYRQQQIPAEVFLPTKLQRYDLKIVIILLLVFIAAVIVFSLACSRIIVPMIGKLRHRVLVEEGGKQNSIDAEKQDEEDIQPPPSSDRQNFNVLDNPNTEAQFK